MSKHAEVIDLAAMCPINTSDVEHPPCAVIPLNPFIHWSVEELEAAIAHNLDRAKYHSDHADQLLGILALRGGPNTSGDVA